MNYFEQYRRDLTDAMDGVDLNRVAQAAAWLDEARAKGRQVFVCGNGGSAATASHFACDLGKGASYGKSLRFKAIALTDQIPTLTAYANDVGYDVVFAEPLKNLAAAEDVVIAISGSGNSPNVLKAVEYANSIGCRTIGLTGRDGGKLGPLCRLHINVPASHMGYIEDAHLIVCHMLCYYFMEEGC